MGLYPLDTIKVRCQATSQGAGTVIQGMVAAAGGPLSPVLWRQVRLAVNPCPRLP